MMNREVAGFPGDDLLLEIKDKIEKYKSKRNPSQKAISEWERILSELYFLLNSYHIKDPLLWQTLEKQVGSIRDRDPEIGIIIISLRVRLNSNKKALINHSNNM